MIKFVFCLRRRPDLSTEEFQRYWREEHAPLVQRCAAAVGMRRYVQVHTLENPLNEALRAGRRALPAYDGIAEAWWDSLESLQELSGRPEGRRAAREMVADERRFIDLEASAVWLGQEYEMIALPGAE
jgi:uncharacterized protein (TIGR02118 family)